MNKYEKQLIEFFTKISEEHSLFSPGFDFSNKKNIVNDKEKLEEIKKIFDQLTLSNTRKVFQAIQKIRKILEE